MICNLSRTNKIKWCTFCSKPTNWPFFQNSIVKNVPQTLTTMFVQTNHHNQLKGWIHCKLL